MKSILVTVFDGLQPDQVTPDLMPNLTTFASNGVAFNNHHSVFPSVTRINASSLVTGRYPGAHGLAGNTILVREFDPYFVFSALEPTLAELSNRTGRVLLVPTIADLLSRHDKEYIAIGTGTTGNAYVHNPNADLSGGATIHPQFCLPYNLQDKLLKRFGSWPEETIPASARISHAVRILTEYILPERKPAVSLIWFSEPDHTQHTHGVGSQIANKAIREVDHQFGRILAWLEQSKTYADTDVLVVSDHGYSTIENIVDVESLALGAGFPPGNEGGGVAVAPNGGSVLFYVKEHNWTTADRLASWLMKQPWCGSIIASQAVPGISGTIQAGVIGNEGERTPDLSMSFMWNSKKNIAGYGGHVFSSSGSSGAGIHGSMSPHEMKNILFATGPSFKTGIAIDHPSGNVDLTPTILTILGISTDAKMDGRSLLEALINGPDHKTLQWSSEFHTAERSVETCLYRQQVTTAKVGTTTYIDEGVATRETLK